MPGVVLDQPADEALHAPDEHAMQHHRPVHLVVRADELELEALGQVEVELHRGPLPLPADRVDELEVELGSVEGPAPLVDRERLARACCSTSLSVFSACAHTSAVPIPFSGRVESSIVYG